MLKKTITYTDYNGEERTEDFYFNINKAEIIEMETTTEGGLGNKLDKMIKAKDAPSLMSFFKELILKSYGEKSDDGRKFVKSKEISNDFAQTEAYSQLFMELITDEEKAASFVNAIIPFIPENEKKNLT